MPNVLQENTDQGTIVYTLQIPAEELESKLTARLKELRKGAVIKGFRKGKVPTSFIRKNYGQSALAEIFNKIVDEEMGEFLKDADNKTLGQLMPVEGQSQIDLSPKNIKDVEYKWEIGAKPEVEVKGLDDSKSYEYYDIVFSDEEIDEQLTNMRKRMGERIVDEEQILKGDMIKFKAKEKAGDTEAEFSLLWDSIADEDLKKTLFKKKKGDTVTFNVFELEKNTTPEYVKKHMLGLPEDAEVTEEFEAEIVEVSRIKEAEMNEAFFTTVFGGRAKNEEEARADIKEQLKKSYSGSADAMLFREVQDHLIESNKDITLPDDFLKRNLIAASEKNTPQLVEENYPEYAEGMRWSLVQEKLFDKYGVKVTEADLREHFNAQMRQYLGNQGNASMFAGMVDRMMQDQNSVNKAASDIGTAQMMLQIKDDLNLDRKEVTVGEMEEIVKAFNEKHAPAPVEGGDEEE